MIVKRYRRNHPNADHQYYLSIKEKHNARSRIYRKVHKKELLEYHRKYRNAIRKKLLILLGGIQCSNSKCLVIGGCRDIRCLHIEHKFGNGNRDRKRFKSAWEFNVYYLMHPIEAKKKLRIFCANCNSIKRYDKKEYRR